MSAPAGGAALVTGAARGLGLAIARELHRRGRVVHLADVDEGAVAAAAAPLGGRHHVLDVTDPEACRAVAAAIEDLALWVNNAGILRTGPAWEQTDEQRRAMLEVNAFGVMHGTLAALEVFRPRGRGHVVNVISLAGLVAAPGETVYAASKHAALAFSLGTQNDLTLAGDRGVRVSALCPDGIWTPMLFDKAHDPSAAISWSGVMLDPETVARRAADLADKPRPVVTLPRRRGAFVRLADAFPGLGQRGLPFIMADARRRQRRWARRHPTGA